MTEQTRSILITGAGQGIGAAAARWFSRHGATRLALVDCAEAQLHSLVGELRASVPALEVTACVLDISQRHAVEKDLRSLLEGWGGLHALVNSAGIADENELEEVEVWQRVLDVNLHGTYFVTCEALRWMPDGGRIVNVSSLLGRAGRVRNTAYCTSKHALLGLTKSLALDLAPRRITVNAVLPGWVDTPMLRREIAAQADLIGAEAGQLLRKARRQIPIRRLIEPQEVAALIGFLTSEEASGITAQSYTIDGGYACGV